MSARLLPAADVQVIISACRAAAELYLRDALMARAVGSSPAPFLHQQAEALRIADDLEARGELPAFIRRQAD